MLDLLPSRLQWLRGQLDRLHASYPTVNVWEDGETYHLEAEMPGLSLEEIELSAGGDELTISGERKGKEEPGVTCHLRERDFGAFSRTIRFDGDIDPEHVNATLKNGVLSVTLPKAEHRKARRIPVKPA